MKEIKNSDGVEWKRYPITPMGKPRMTRRDKWAKRPVVLRYFAFRDLVKLHNVDLPKRGAMVIFCIPMPKSWSKKKKTEMSHKPHEQTPDIDNLLKGLMDAVYKDDSGVSDITVRKIWDYEGSIITNRG